MSVQLKPHQLKALGEMKNGCILRGGVGTGKTFTGLAYFLVRECGGDLQSFGRGMPEGLPTPKDLYVITTAKKRDDKEWEGDAAKFALSHTREDSLGGIQVTVDSWNNIVNYAEVKDAFFIFDEQRLVGSGAWVKAFIKIARANNWIMLSATPGDNWMDYIPVFVANGFFKNRTEFIRNHVVFSTYTKFPKVERYIGTEKLLRLKSRVVVEMPFNRHTTRHVKQIIVDFDPVLFNRAFKDRWHIYEERPIRDVAELFIVMRKVVNSDLSRMAEVMRRFEKHPRLIIFYNFNYELERLRTLAGTLNIPVAEWNGHKHQPIPDADSWIYLVQYTAGAEGWNCILTDAMLFYSLNYSWKINEQARGRIDRMNTPFFDLYYYILRSNSPIDNSIMKALAEKRTFNEKELVKEL